MIQPTDAPKLGLVSPSDGSGEGLVEILLNLPMGWKKSPLILCMTIYTVADLVNEALCYNQLPRKHKLDNPADLVIIPESCPPHPSLAGLIHYP